MSEQIFKPNDEARAAFNRMSNELADRIMDNFFGLWEAEGDPRRAGSMAAHAYIKNAAKVAVFGAKCSGHTPDKALWLAACGDAYEAATKEVSFAFTISVENDKPQN